MKFVVSGKVHIFPGISGWHWVGVPQDVSQAILDKTPKGRFRFAPVFAKLGKTEWKTALLPLGEGKFFIAIKTKVRKVEGVMMGDTVTISISL